MDDVSRGQNHRWDHILREACDAMTEHGRTDALKMSLTRLQDCLRMNQLEGDEKKLIATIVHNVKGTLHIAKEMTEARFRIRNGLETSLKELECEDLSNMDREESDQSCDSLEIVDLTPTYHLRSWFLSHIISPFPSSSDKSRLRSLVPDSTNAHLNGWMANMRRRSGWTAGVTEYGTGSKSRWQEVIRRVEEGDQRTTRGEREYVKGMKDYVMGKRRPPVQMTRVGDWLEKVIPGSSAPEDDTSTADGKVTKRRRTAHGKASVTVADAFDREARSTDETGMDFEEEVEVKREESARAPPQLHLPFQHSPYQRPLPSVTSILESRHLPLPPALASPVPRTVSASSSGTNISAISEGQVFYQQPQMMYMPTYQYAAQPIQMAGPVAYIASPPPAQAQFMQGPFVFTGTEGGSYVPFNPYIPTTRSQDGWIKQEEGYRRDVSRDQARGNKRGYEEGEEMGPAWKRARG